MSWFYLSFADETLPEGEQFLGGAYVEANSPLGAITRAHLEGFNPGGEVVFVEVPEGDEFDAEVPKTDRNRLLTRAELAPAEVF